MKYWSRYPVFRFLIPFTAGILTGIYHEFSLLPVSLAVVVTWAVAFWFTRKNLASGKYAHRWLAGIPFYICFATLGYLLTWFYQSKNFANHFSLSGDAGVVILQLTEEPVRTHKGLRVTGQVLAKKEGDIWKPVRGSLMIFIADTSSGIEMYRGDKMVTNATWKRIPPPANPGAFNYAAFMEGKSVWHQGFVSNNQYLILEKRNKQTIFSIASSVREELLSQLKKHIPGTGELGVAAALLLGYDDWLDPDLELQYASTGVLHILCVSGMHVGLVYMIFSWLLVWMEKKPVLRHLRFATLIILVWFYAMVTGLAPSVIRASTMLTFVIAGRWINKNTNIYNSLCVSCIFMFALNPYLVMSAGFQLSFLAVCGIVFFQKMFLSLWTAPSTFLQKGWELISVSIAAQLATSPLSIFLFNQFPNYFILGNLFIIPLTPVVMYSGLSLFVTEWIPWAGTVTGTILSFTIGIINAMVVFFGSLPGAVTTGIFISFYEMILFYLLILLVFAWIVNKSVKWLYTVMCVLMVVLSIRIYQVADATMQKVVTVYDSRYNSLVSILEGRNATVISDKEIDEKTLRYSLNGHLLQSMTKSTQHFETAENTCYRIKTLNAIFIKDYQPEIDGKQDSVYILILGGTVKGDATTLIKTYKPQTVVFDASCRRWQVQKLQMEFRQAGIATHNVKTDGAFQYVSTVNPLFHLKEMFLSSGHLSQ